MDKLDVMDIVDQGSYLTDKKKNVCYWDQIDSITEDYLIRMAGMGGLCISSVDIDAVKKVVEEAISQLEKSHKGVHFPFVNEDY